MINFFVKLQLKPFQFYIRWQILVDDNLQLQFKIK